MIKEHIIYYLRWKDGLYSVVIDDDYDSIFRDLPQDRFYNLLKSFPNAKLVDVSTIIKKGE